MSDPANGNVQVVVRRRRTHRHRRNRLVRRWLAVLCLTFFAAGASTVALRYFSPSIFRAKQVGPSITAERADLIANRSTLSQVLSQSQPSRPVYPYSVVPGGVEDARELKWIAEHDPIVGAHYAGFDYAHAQVVRLTLARTVYVSYRIGNRIYWTRRRVTLHKGEKLITDGKITARSRCGNRVEETPQQQAAAPVEPPIEKFDEPIKAGIGSAMQAPPMPFESALLNRPSAPGFEALGPLAAYDPLVGGSFMPIAAPPLPSALCAPFKKTKNGGVEIAGPPGKKKKLGPCGSEGGGSGPGVVPEPGTWLLFASGLAFVVLTARRKLFAI